MELVSMVSRLSCVSIVNLLTFREDKQVKQITEEQIEFMRQDLASNFALSKMIETVKERLGDRFEAEFEKFKQEGAGSL